MKKLGKKLSYLAKVFMAVGLLFYNVSSISIVFADEVDGEGSSETEKIDGNEVTLDGENDNDKSPGNDTLENEDDEEGGDEEDDATEKEGTEGVDDEENQGAEGEETGEGENQEGTDGEEPSTGEEPTQVAFGVSVYDYYLVINHSGALDLEDGSIVLTENFTYTDGTSVGENVVEIPLTDDVRNALVNDEGYEYDSEMLLGNEFNGTYSVTVSLGGEERTGSLLVENNDEGMEWDLLYMLNDGGSDEEGVMPTYDVAEKNGEGKYVIPVDANEVLIVGWLNPGGITPSMTFTYDGIEYSAEEMFWGNVFEIIDFDGHLHGEFTKTVTVSSSNGKTYSESFPIVYGEYQDNTDMLNEAAKNVGLDSNYIFVGDSANGTLYYLGELEEGDLANIIDEAFNEAGFITYTFENGVLTLEDDNGVVVTYGEAELSDETQIVGVLDAILDSEEAIVTSGDTFTVDYIVTLKDFAINGISGLITYDKEILSLTKVEATQFTGNNNEGKFMYLGDSIMGDEAEDGTISDKDYVLLTLTFEALKEGTSTITIEDAKFFNGEVYYGPSGEIETEIEVAASSDSSLSSLTVAGQEISLTDELEYAITVSNDVTMSDVLAIASNSNARIEIDGPEELAVGENVFTITVTSEDGSSEKVYTVKVTREEPKAEENSVAAAPVTYQEPATDDSTDNTIVPDDGKKKDDKKDDTEEDEEKSNNLSRIIIVILILLVIAGLIYLIFKDDDDDETKQANKDIDKLKKEDNFGEKNNKYNNNKNNKKGR